MVHLAGAQVGATEGRRGYPYSHLPHATGSRSERGLPLGSPGA